MTARFERKRLPSLGKSLVCFHLFWAFLYHPEEEKEEQGEKKSVDEKEEDNGAEYLVAPEDRRNCLVRLEDALDDPGLPAHLGGEPARLAGDLRQQRRADEQPEEGADGLGLCVPEFTDHPQEAAQERKSQECHAYGNHQMVSLEDHRHVGPILGTDFCQYRVVGTWIAGAQKLIGGELGQASPMVIGGKRKWNETVKTN
jgi:hypothetical protein